VNGAIFLNVASITDFYSAPVAAYRRAGPDVNVFSNDHIPGYRCIRMNECGRMYHGSEAFKGKDIAHNSDVGVFQNDGIALAHANAHGAEGIALLAQVEFQSG